MGLVLVLTPIITSRATQVSPSWLTHRNGIMAALPPQSRCRATVHLRWVLTLAPRTLTLLLTLPMLTLAQRSPVPNSACPQPRDMISALELRGSGSMAQLRSMAAHQSLMVRLPQQQKGRVFSFKVPVVLKLAKIFQQPMDR